tara:strand:- start:103 stop:321 length:219 start_codon:yes stop_codon:yes gene_type:complete
MVNITELQVREINKLIYAIDRSDLRKLCIQEFIASVDDAERTITACVEKIIKENPERLYAKDGRALRMVPKK